jgi:hypothetical protein
MNRLVINKVWKGVSMLAWEHASRERFATRNTLFYLRRAELSTGARLILFPCCQNSRQEKRAAAPHRWGGKMTPALTRRVEMLSNSGFPGRISVQISLRLLVRQRAKEYLLWRVAGLTLCEMSLAPNIDGTSDPILHFILL